MKKTILSILLICNLLGCASKEDKLLIAVSANAQFAIEEIVNQFKKQNETNIEIIIGSSGGLTSQILNGAPFDVFLSADIIYPNIIEQNNLGKEIVEIYARGILIQWSLSHSDKSIFNHLNFSALKNIAMANPTNAPYGRAAKEVLEKLKISDSSTAKFVFGESISQTNQYIISKSVDFGYTSKSVLYQKNFSQIGIWAEVDSSMYSPIEQGIILLSEKSGAKDFYQYVLSAEAGNIFEKFGYKKR